MEEENIWDVIVIGGGIMGSATIADLAKSKMNVLLLEKFEFGHDRGSSHGESRIFRLAYPDPVYTEMCIKAMKMWEEAQGEDGVRVLEYTGGLDMGSANGKDLREVKEALEKWGIDHEELTPSQVLSRFNGVIKLASHQKAIYSKQAGIIKASEAVFMFQRLARNYGARLKDRCEVLDIKTVHKDGEEICRVETEHHSFYGRKCVLTCGAWTKKFLKRVGSRDYEAISPIHTFTAYWKCREPTKYESDSFPIFLCYDEPFMYGLPIREKPGLLKVCYHSGPPCDPDDRPKCPEVESLEKIRTFIRDHFEGVSDDLPNCTEQCMYTMTPDQDFLLDFFPEDEKIIVGAGFSGHGFKMAPVIGRVLADMTRTGKNCKNRDKFSFHRDTMLSYKEPTMS